MQLFYNLSDPGMEDMVESVRRFVGETAWAAAGRDDDSELRHLLRA